MRRSYVLFYTAQGFDVHIITRSSEDGDWMDGSRSEARFRRQAAMDERLRGFFKVVFVSTCSAVKNIARAN